MALAFPPGVHVLVRDWLSANHVILRGDDGAEVLAKQPGDAPVTALAWNASGKLFAFGTESGEAGVIDLG